MVKLTFQVWWFFLLLKQLIKSIDKRGDQFTMPSDILVYMILFNN